MNLLDRVRSFPCHRQIATNEIDRFEALGCLCGHESGELAVLIRETEFVVGPWRRRPDDVQRQCRTHHDVPHQSSIAIQTAECAGLVWSDAGGVFHWTAFRTQLFVYGATQALVGNWNSTLDPQPMIDGARFSFKPTPNVEFGFSRTTLFAGQGVPFTTHTFLRSFFALNNALPEPTSDAGDRRSGFDLIYRLPFLRNWATFYADGFTDDQFYTSGVLGSLCLECRALFLAYSGDSKTRFADGGHATQICRSGEQCESRILLLERPISSTDTPTRVI